MRLFFLVLLLANLALWYWHEPVWHEPVSGWLQKDPPERSIRPPAPAPDVPRLILLSELESEETQDQLAKSSAPQAEPPTVAPVEQPVDALAEAAPQTAVPPPAAAPDKPPQTRAPTATRSARTTAGSCFEVGAWSELAAAEAALATAKAGGAAAEVVKVEQQHQAGWWMLTADRYERAEARETLRRLQELGVNDIAIVSLDSGWAISLGLFSRNSALERRRAQMLELGYTPEVRERTVTHTEYRLRLTTGVDLRSIAERLAGESPELEWRTVECPSAQD